MEIYRKGIDEEGRVWKYIEYKFLGFITKSKSFIIFNNSIFNSVYIFRHKVNIVHYNVAFQKVETQLSNCCI